MSAKVVKCWCGHKIEKHLSRTRHLPPYCSVCKGGKAAHDYSETKPEVGE